MAVLLARRWFPGSDPYHPEVMAGALILDERETERVRVAVHNGIVSALKVK